MRQLNWQVSISTPVPDIESLKNTLMKKLGLWCRNCRLWNWDPNEDIVTLMNKLRLWKWDPDEEIGTLWKKLGLWKRDPDEVVKTLLKKSGPKWRNLDSDEEIGTLMKILGLMKKLVTWWKNWDSEIGTCVKKFVPFLNKLGLVWRNWYPLWRNWDADEEIGTLMKTHPAVIYLSVRSRLPPPLMIIALAAGSSLCLDWYASFRVSLRFCAVVQLHLSWCIPYIYKIVREGSNLNQLPNEVIFALYSVSFVSIINFETIPWLKQR